MDKKLPKLQVWKQAGARTLLALENGDMALSNHWVILEATDATLAGRLEPPDEVWLVDTTIEHEWTVCCLIRDGIRFPDTMILRIASGSSSPPNLAPSGNGVSASLHRLLNCVQLLLEIVFQGNVAAYLSSIA
jgi:hypothetical protein